MKIIGHRGAASLAPENTISAIYAAIEAGVDGIEVDIRVTADKQIVLSHDPDFSRTCLNDSKISETPISTIQKLQTIEGEPIPSLKKTLSITGTIPLYIEGKGKGWARPLAKLIKNSPNKSSYTVISFNHYELSSFQTLCPDIKVYVIESRNGFDAINAARIFGFDGIDINYWTLNPLVYWLAHRHNLDICVYTVDNTWVASFLQILYPNIKLTTNVPHKMQFLRPRKLRIKKSKTK